MIPIIRTMEHYIQIQDQLRKQGVKFDPGLSEEEFKQIEGEFGICFPPDLRKFLSKALPISEKWMNWRGEKEEIRERLNWPYEGIWFDIENNDFWIPEFGAKPDNLKECFQLARNYLDGVPKLIPIYAHRYIPDSPHEDNNPIFSVYQTDVIYYGSHLMNYFANEFQLKNRNAERVGDEFIKQIGFWSKLEAMGR